MLIVPRPARLEEAAQHDVGVEVLLGQLPGGAAVAAVVGHDPLDRGDRVLERAEGEEALACRDRAA